MRCDLIIDGNYILSRLVFTLHKNNLLYGALHKALENAMLKYKKWYPFANVYLVSDSKEKSWRKKYIDEYKGTRKKNTDIDWKFVYEAYGEFKESMEGTFKILEAPHIEGDDWIAYLVEKANEEGRSTIIVSNDYDIKQMVKHSFDPLWVNMMTNEMYNKEKLFLPENYQNFINKVQKIPNDNIFDINDNTEFLRFINGFIKKYEVVEINYMKSLMVKIISGDKSDNIGSVWSVIKNGKKRGIGYKGAQTIYDDYLLEFGEMSFTDPDMNENIADLICEKKKLSKTKIDEIVENIESNFTLIDLRISNLPTEVVNKMIITYNDKYKK
jgi:5'-3' exonuclease